MSTPFVTPEPVEHEVAGQNRKFWPMSVNTIFKLQGLATPISKALAAFLTNSQNDTGQEQSKVESAEGNRQERLTIQPITSELARVRFQQRQEAIELLTGGILNERTAKVLAEVVMNSMREDFPKGSSVADFLEQTTAPVFMEMLSGVAKANKKLFDPLKVKADEIKATIRAGLGNLQPATQPAAPSSEAATTQSG